MSERLRKAFASEPVPPGLETRLKAITAQPRRRPWLWAAGVAAMAALVFGVFYIRKLQAVDAILAVTEPGLHSILRVGLRDHIYCAVMRRYGKNAPPVEKVASDLPAEMRPLAAIVRANVPERYQLHVAHVCKFKGRAYVHLALHDGTRIVSVMMTRREGGETITRSDLLAVTSQAGVDVFSGGSNGYDVSAFEKADWLVFLVSDAAAAESRGMFASMAPALRDFLDRV